MCVCRKIDLATETQLKHRIRQHYNNVKTCMANKRSNGQISNNNTGYCENTQAYKEGNNSYI